MSPRSLFRPVALLVAVAGPVAALPPATHRDA
jgi:hypothetical protein